MKKMTSEVVPLIEMIYHLLDSINSIDARVTEINDEERKEKLITTKLSLQKKLKELINKNEYCY